jgi:hypothetical protein
LIITSIKISEQNDFVYYKTEDGVLHGEPLNTEERKDYWIKLAVEHSNY